MIIDEGMMKMIVGYVLLAQWQPIWVDVISLEGSKEEFHGAGRIGMWTCEHDGKVVLRVEVHHLRRGVVGRIVEKYDVVLPPVPILLVHHLDEAAEEHLHHR